MTELSKDSKRVSCKWAFKTKRDFKGNVERYKARLASKAYTQNDDIDYKEIFFLVRGLFKDCNGFGGSF